MDTSLCAACGMGLSQNEPDERCGICGRYVWCVIKVVYDDAEGDASEDVGGGAYRWP